MISPSLLVLLVFPAGLIAAAIKDATTFTIPNWISAALALAFWPAALMVHLPLSALGWCAAMGVAGLVVGIGLFALGWCGGGDAKLLAASALWLGWPGVLPFLAFTGIAGGALAAGLLAARTGMLAPYVARGPSWLGRLLSPEEDLPYGLAIAAGALAAFPASSLVRAVTAG